MGFKRGDRVKLVSTIGECDRYEGFLGREFTVEQDCGIYVDLLETETILPYVHNLELVEDKKTIALDELQGGDIVTCKNGIQRIVDMNRKRTVYLNNFECTGIPFSRYNQRLQHVYRPFEEWDIVEVFRPTTKETFVPKEKEAEAEIKELTVAEIEKELGYKVKIIKEDK